MGTKRFFSNAYQLRTRSETRRFYEDWAQSYDQEIAIENDYRQPERCAMALAKVVRDMSLPVLDIGCGTGLSGVALRAIGFANIEGCDLSPQMLEKAGETKCYNRLFETDLNSPPIDIKSGTINAITAVGVFSFGHVAPDALDEFLRILVPGGVFVIGLNDHFHDEGTFQTKLSELADTNKIKVISRQHGLHLAKVAGSTGWVITCRKIG